MLQRLCQYQRDSTAPDDIMMEVPVPVFLFPHSEIESRLKVLSGRHTDTVHDTMNGKILHDPHARDADEDTDPQRLYQYPCDSTVHIKTEWDIRTGTHGSIS